MNRSLFLGSLVGILLTLAVAYFLWDSGKLQRMSGAVPGETAQSSSPAGGVTLVGAIDNVEAGLPPVTDGYEPTAASTANANLLAYRAKLQPSMSLQSWDRLLAASGFSPMERSTADCSSSAPEQALTLPAHQAESVADGSTNVVVIDSRAVKCFVVGGKVSILSDNLASGDRIYNIHGEALIERLIEVQTKNLSGAFLASLKVNRFDFSYLMNPDLSPRRSVSTVTLLRIKFVKQSPLIDSTKVPPFAPGAISLKPQALKTYFSRFRLPGKPVFVDARDRKNISSGETYADAVQAPFISSNPKQLKFDLAMPMALVVGARFDLRRLPKDQETPLLLFGNDETDASPLWVLWHLRQNGYRTVFLIEGGLKALKQSGPVISF